MRRKRTWWWCPSIATPLQSVLSFPQCACIFLLASYFYLPDSSFHVLWNHSHNVSRFCNKLDYSGILVLMWGAGIPTIYYGFICNPSLQMFYWTMVRPPVLLILYFHADFRQTTSTALCCAIFTLTPAFVTPQYRQVRASFYAGFGLSSIIFVVHGLLLHGWELQKSRMSLMWMGWMATANLVGACIYAARVRSGYQLVTFFTDCPRFLNDGFPTHLTISAQATSSFTWPS